MNANLRRQLNRLDVSKLKMANGKSVESELRRHAKILADCILEELRNVYNSYSPKVYTRSNNLYDSVYIDDGIKIDFSSQGKCLSIKVSFDEKAMHDNFYGEESNVALLINEGWRWKDTSISIPYLSEREGTHFIEKGIEMYKRSVNNPFKVRFTLDDRVDYF